MIFVWPRRRLWNNVKALKICQKELIKKFKNKPLFNLLFKTHILADFPKKNYPISGMYPIRH